MRETSSAPGGRDTDEVVPPHASGIALGRLVVKSCRRALLEAFATGHWEMFRILPAIIGALAVLAAVVVLFVWFEDRGRGTAEVVIALSETVDNAATPDLAMVSGQDPASAPRDETGNRSDTDRSVGGETAYLPEPVESPADDLEDLSVAAGGIGDAESASSESTRDFLDESDTGEGEPLSLSADAAAWAVGAEGEPDQFFSTIEEPAGNGGRQTQAVPSHGRLAWFEFGVLNRGSNLRENPSVDAPIVARLAPGARVRMLEAEPVLGYYRVSSGEREGWVWWLNVDPQNTDDFWG